MSPHLLRLAVVLSLVWLPGFSTASASEPVVPVEQAEAAMRKACDFFYENCSKRGGYVWRYSKDLTLSEGEAETGPDTIWVQPPGTPTVGLAYLAAYDATGDVPYLDYAAKAADALVKGQLQSGTWNYRIELDPEERKKWAYLDQRTRRPPSRGRDTTNISTLDDDTTQAALRFLMKTDESLGFRNPDMHQSVLRALEALMIVQHDNGGWIQNWDRDPKHLRRYEDVGRASYPETWSRRWLNDWPGRYYLNDNVTGDVIELFLDAWDIYGDERYLATAKKSGDFLLAAQMPEPQPAWAQQYDAQFQPCWDRKFEPPAIASHESQLTIGALMMLARRTGERRYLEPIPAALAYLRSSLRPDGTLSRFYELKTNRPIYFNTKYEITYDDSDLPTHYGFIRESELDELQRQYDQLSALMSRSGVEIAETEPEVDAQEIRQILAGQTAEGAWIDAGNMKGFGKASREGVIQSETFAHNVQRLAAYIKQK